MLRRAIEQFQKVTEQDPKDIESWLMLGRLQRINHNSVEAEKAYKKVLDQDASNEEALTGLAMVYSEVGDTKNAIEMLRLVTEQGSQSADAFGAGQLLRPDTRLCERGRCLAAGAADGSGKQPHQARAGAGRASSPIIWTRR